MTLQIAQCLYFRNYKTDEIERLHFDYTGVLNMQTYKKQVKDI